MWTTFALDTAKGVLYVNTIDWCTSVRIQSPDTLHGPPGQAWSGMDDPKHTFGVLFTGDLDGNALAYDAATGKELWHAATGKAIGGGVISYDAGGKQYVAVAAGMNSTIWPVKGGKASVVVYALP